MIKDNPVLDRGQDFLIFIIKLDETNILTKGKKRIPAKHR